MLESTNGRGEDRTPGLRIANETLRVESLNTNLNYIENTTVAAYVNRIGMKCFHLCALRPATNLPQRLFMYPDLSKPTSSCRDAKVRIVNLGVGPGGLARSRKTVAAWILNSRAASAAVLSPLETILLISACC